MFHRKFEIDDCVEDDTAVFTVYGTFLRKSDLARLQERLEHFAGLGISRVVIDVSGVSLFGAAFLGWLVSSRRNLESSGGDIRLVGVSSRLKRVLRVTRLSPIFRRYKTVAEAVSSFASRPVCNAA